MNKRLKVLLVVGNVGPYHEARAEAAAQRLDVHIIERERKSRIYDWDHKLDGKKPFSMTSYTASGETFSSSQFYKFMVHQIGKIRPDVVCI